MHSNISSIKGYLENLHTLLGDLDYNLDIIALSETWHTKENDASITQLNIKGYHNYIGCNGSSLKGGCGFFVADHLSFALEL